MTKERSIICQHEHTGKAFFAKKGEVKKGKVKEEVNDQKYSKLLC